MARCILFDIFFYGVLFWWNRGWAALLGDPSVIAPEDRSEDAIKLDLARLAGTRPA